MGKLSCAFEKADENVTYSYGAMNFHSRGWQFVSKYSIANSCARWRCNFKGLSQHRGQADFSKNFRASFFNDDQSNEPNLGRIHLVGQYL
jgi:hypothetical protein